MSVFKGIQPFEVWRYFNDILQIPRPSKSEEKVILYLEKVAEQHGLDVEKDSCGNVVIKKEGTEGFEDKKTVVLQSHIDMVCEKNSDSDHDFFTDPIKPLIDNGWVTADGTTLGADDGIGMAMQLALLTSSDIEHPPLECLFTVDEESGLTGAFGLSTDILKGRTLINLDSEDEGEIYIGCAGGMDSVITFNYETVSASASDISYRLEVKGLRGGHSGDDIDKGYGNSVKILNRLIWSANNEFEVDVVEFYGGNLRNAIPREAYAIINVRSGMETVFEEFISGLSNDIIGELEDVEPNIDISLKVNESVHESVMHNNDKQRFLNALYSCPNGVVSMSRDMPGLVETSTNLASVKFKDGNSIEIVTSQRSSVESAKEDICNMVTSVFELAGAEVRHTDGYPGWKPDTNSKLLKVAESAYESRFGKKAEVKAIHAGLECGLFLEKYPDMDMISIGPTLRGVHSPDERLEIESVSKCWEFLKEILVNV